VPYLAQAGAPRKGRRCAGLRICAGSLWCARFLHPLVRRI